ncbi:hypothetical protein DM02DRAFT_58053 [Periconia macrospinosa]|uniref:Uncharacterized protein n=1 Tax=Periconia macrospinosa TaxID=97972 RepID=A0A2V1DJ13_9PLEO|nr:hypothetical protein DM02DRAFT_58053 [Periconia macrospinosa]
MNCARAVLHPLSPSHPILSSSKLTARFFRPLPHCPPSSSPPHPSSPLLYPIPSHPVSLFPPKSKFVRGCFYPNKKTQTNKKKKPPPGTFPRINPQNITTQILIKHPPLLLPSPRPPFPLPSLPPHSFPSHTRKKVLSPSYPPRKFPPRPMSVFNLT